MAGVKAKTVVAKMISIRISRVNSRVLESPSGVVELTMIVMFEGEAIKATLYRTSTI